MKLLVKLKQYWCNHGFYIEDLTRHPEFENTDQRVSWSCYKCGKLFKAHCGLDITPKHGYVMRKTKITSYKDNI